MQMKVVVSISATVITKDCVACHEGVNVGRNGYYPLGVAEEISADILLPGGRFAVSKTAIDEYVFRDASLRSVAPRVGRLVPALRR
jgi:cytochrome c peroxidase